jgi:5-methyltetrahydrofolate--homocysteine methyltransferase
MQILREIAEYLQQGDDEKVSELVRQAIHENIPPREILDGSLIAGMDAIGEQFRKREIFLPEVLLAAKAMYAGMDLLKPLFVKEKLPTMGKIVIGTVHGDVHDIGKNLVGIMLEGAGFEVIDLGKDVPPEKFIQIAQKEDAQVIGMSALLTTTMPVMKHVVDLLRERGLDGKIKTIIGGAPASEEYAREIRADAYGYDAANAVQRVRQLIAGERRPPDAATGA